MESYFEQSRYLSCLYKGNLRAAMSYLARFPAQSELYGRYVSRYQEETYRTYDVDTVLNEILLAYQKYYREAFYLELDLEDAAQRLQSRLAKLFGLDAGVSLEEIEKKQAPEAFVAKGFHFLGGKTSGCFGPYIWQNEELKQYTIELPNGQQSYTVKLLDGFVMESWLDYLSFGETGTGGWSNGDGLICCVKPRYDLESESFLVSLLKHEAQHAKDHEQYPGVSSGDLEYRAKLTELIYSSQRNLLDKFLLQADGTKTSDGHCLSAERIVRSFEHRLHKDRSKLAGLPVETTQAVSRELFVESEAEMATKYC